MTSFDIWAVVVITSLALGWFGVSYRMGKVAGFKLGRQEPTEIQVIVERPVPQIVYVDKEVEKVVYKPTKPQFCQCGHGICYHHEGKKGCYLKPIDGYTCNCQVFTEV